MDADKADYFEEACKLFTTTKRAKRVSGSKVPANESSQTNGTIKSIHNFFNDVRGQFFHADYPRNGTKIANMETTVPENIRAESNGCPTDIVIRLVAGCLHRLVFDDRDSIMGRALITRSRKFFKYVHP